MNTKTFNHFRNTFAFIGFFIIACSVGTVEDETPELPTPVQTNNGKYQAAALSSTVVFLNTSTGKVKTLNWHNGEWIDQNADLTLTH